MQLQIHLAALYWMYGKFVALLDSIFDQNQLVTFHRDFTKVDEKLPRVALVFDSDLS